MHLLLGTVSCPVMLDTNLVGSAGDIPQTAAYDFSR